MGDLECLPGNRERFIYSNVTRYAQSELVIGNLMRVTGEVKAISRKGVTNTPCLKSLCTIVVVHALLSTLPFSLFPLI